MSRTTCRNGFIFVAAMCMGLMVTSARGGTLDSPAAPTDSSSAMYTAKDVFNRLDTGAAGVKRTGAFAEPAAGPTAGTMPTLDEIMAKAPATNANAAVASEVLNGKVYWGLKNNAWGQHVGALATPAAPAGAVYRWNVFHTYSDFGWVTDIGNNDGGNSNLFGGVQPRMWSDMSATASQMSSDKEVLRTLYIQKGYGGKNATIVATVEKSYSSTDAGVATALFRITNTTASAINWMPCFYYTCYSSYQNVASVALNGSNSWNSGTANGEFRTYVTLTIPPARISTVIFVSTSGFANAGGSDRRELILAFCSNSLALPTGLEYVDDLDTATGGWDQ